MMNENTYFQGDVNYIDAKINLLLFNDEILEMIFSNLSYQEIARNRIVCKRMNNIGKKLLNKGFDLVAKYQKESLSSIKCQLPLKKSERKMHNLSKHCHTLNRVGVLIWNLDTAYRDSYNTDMYCFIPGKVLDEIFQIISLINNSSSLSKNHDNLLVDVQEMSIMAIQHFYEKIKPNLQHESRLIEANDSLDFEDSDKQSILEEIEVLTIRLHDLRMMKIQEISQQVQAHEIQLLEIQRTLNLLKTPIIIASYYLLRTLFLKTISIIFK